MTRPNKPDRGKMNTVLFRSLERMTSIKCFAKALTSKVYLEVLENDICSLIIEQVEHQRDDERNSGLNKN